MSSKPVLDNATYGWATATLIMILLYSFMDKEPHTFMIILFWVNTMSFHLLIALEMIQEYLVNIIGKDLSVILAIMICAASFFTYMRLVLFKD